MRVLVTAASRHGSTMAIAEAIGQRLRDEGVEADVQPVGEVRSLDPYEAVILGSGVYIGRWLPTATRFAEDHVAALRARHVWLFSSGPIGAPEAKPDADPEGVDDLVSRVGALGHARFNGRIDRRLLGISEKIVIKAVGAPEGDFRDWPQIEAWAADIARALPQVSAGGARR